MTHALPVILWILLSLAALTLVGLFGRAIFRNPRGDFETGFAFVIGKIYVRSVHALRVRGRNRIPDGPSPGPLIVACNHTAGVDPMLVQAACPFMIRWVMAEDMRVPGLEWFWKWWDVIFVDRARPESLGFRAALRHLKRGGVIGIFPEGGLERPPRRILPFQRGVGLLVRRTGARVLVVTIDGTPQVDPAWASLWHMSRSVVHVREMVDYSDRDLTPAEITEDLRRRFLVHTGWPANDTVPGLDEIPGPGKKGRPVPIAHDSAA